MTEHEADIPTIQEQPMESDTPTWHAGVLAARLARLVAGEELILDWEPAKIRIHEHSGRFEYDFPD